MEVPSLTSAQDDVTSPLLSSTSLHKSATSTQAFMTSPQHRTTDGSGVSDVALLASLAVIGVVSAAANGIVVLTISMTRKMRVTSSSFFLLSVAVADIALTGLVVPLAASGVVSGNWAISQALCRLTVALTTVFSVGSALSVAAIALDRYLAILHCLHYSVWPRWRYVSIVMAAIWLHALFFGILSATDVVQVAYIPAQYFCDVIPSQSVVYVWVKAVFVFFIPLIVLVFSYAKVIHVARIHSRKIDVATPSLRRNGSSSDSLRRSDTVTTNGAVAAGAMFSVRRLSVMSFPQPVDGSSRQLHLTGDLELMGVTLPGVTPSAEAYQTLHRSSCTSFRLITLIVVFLVCLGCHVCVSLYGTLHSDVDDAAEDVEGVSKTTKAGPVHARYQQVSLGMGDAEETVYKDAGYKRESSSPRDLLITASFLLTMVNSMLNPFLYAISSQRFRFFASRLFARKMQADSSQPAGNVFDVSQYSVYLRNLQSPSSRRRNSADSCHSDSLHQLHRSTTEPTLRRNSDTSTGTSCSYVDSRQNSPRCSRPSSPVAPGVSIRRTSSSSRQFLEVPSLLFQDGCSSTDTEEELEVCSSYVHYKKRRVSLPGSPRSARAHRSGSCDSGQSLGMRRSSSGPGSPDDDFVFSANNAARIRIVLDLV